MSGAPAEAPPRPQTNCPTCGAPAERGQLVCLECGSRIALAYRRPPSWKIPLAITLVLLLLAGAAAVLAYRAIDGDAESEVAATPVKVNDSAREADAGAASGGQESEPAPGARNEGEDEAGGGASEEEEPTSASGGLVKDGALYTWPRDLDGFTVVLLSNEDRASATSFAESAAGRPGSEIGVIRSNDFESLPKGFFIVFAGEYPNRAKADAAAARLGGRFPGAFPQAVRG